MLSVDWIVDWDMLGSSTITFGPRFWPGPLCATDADAPPALNPTTQTASVTAPATRAFINRMPISSLRRNPSLGRTLQLA